ncbi:hypothetical protein TNCV_34191 [Trichonephila clavipes]|nr:hypothetical protein TNCV_34191 [Trichonephila clavipes]
MKLCYQIIPNPPTGQHGCFCLTREASKTDQTEYFSQSLSSLLNYLRAFGDGPVAGVPGGQGIESWLAGLEFEPSATKDPPFHSYDFEDLFNSIDLYDIIKPDGHGYELVSSVRALVPQKFSVEEELMHVKHVEVKSPHVGVMWKFGRGVISSGIDLVT